MTARPGGTTDPFNAFSDCKTVEQLITTAVGAGSCCWEDVDGDRVFASEDASKIVSDVLGRLSELEAERTAIDALVNVLADFAIADEHTHQRNDQQLATLLYGRGVRVQS